MENSKLETRKEFERIAFNQQAIKSKLNFDVWKHDFGSNSKDSSEFNDSFLNAPYTYIEKKIRNDLKGKRILDYCCGTGNFSIYPALNGAFVDGIDISEVSIEVAKARAEYCDVTEKVNFQVMDAENLQFDDNFFDIILSYGSLSYLNLQKALHEFLRTIKPLGIVVIVDTLGHNPILNYNRKKYVKKGIRQQYHYDHILKIKDIKFITSHFSESEVRFFDFLTIPLYPCKTIPGAKILKNILAKFDNIFLQIPGLNRFAFKVVITLLKPKKELLNLK